MLEVESYANLHILKVSSFRILRGTGYSTFQLSTLSYLLPSLWSMHILLHIWAMKYMFYCYIHDTWYSNTLSSLWSLIPSKNLLIDCVEMIQFLKQLCREIKKWQIAKTWFQFIKINKTVWLLDNINFFT